MVNKKIKPDSAGIEPTTKVSYLLCSNNERKWAELEATPTSDTAEAIQKAKEESKSADKQLSEYLHSVLTAQNIVILSGCGSSLGQVGGPSMADLWGNATKIPNFQQVQNIVKHADDNIIENLLSRCQAARLFLDGDDLTKVNTFLAAAEKMIWDECSKFLDGADLEGHKTFIKRMARRRLRSPRLKLFTTNYDLCFEKAAGELGLIVIDGFSFSQPRKFNPRYFNYDIVRRAKGSDETNDFIEGVVQIFKLHGSVDWDCSEDVILQKMPPIKPCLIYPVSTKYEQTYTQPHLELMSQLLAALREPNTCLITIGFGFNDIHLSAPVLAAVETNPSLKLLVVDKNGKEKSEHKGAHKILFQKITEGETNIALLNADFLQFTKLIPNLQALSSAEQVERTLKQISRGT